jgi:two-component system phosphate regulon sensor histidine kinase PhoR
VGKPLYDRDLAREGVSELRLRAVLHREAGPPLPSGGPTEAFYLGIIALAALGLIAGGAVLLRMWRREVRLARLKADFVSNLSHELKTPLTSISLFTEMLQEGKLASEEERREGLAVLAQESQRLQRIVARMIDVARREVRGTPYDLVLGDLNGAVREAAQRFRRIVTEPGLDLVVNLSPEPLPVRMDAAAVDDAVTNLLSNAWKYKRGERARIEVRTRRRRGKAELTVIDDGIGISRHERKRVFEMFYRAENYLTRSVAGTGLGLALVRTIVRAHKGRIKLESGQGGVGSAFRLRFPLARVRDAAPETAASAPAPASAPTSSPSATSSPSPMRAADALAAPGPTRAQSTP